jgi:hypothetical protein
MMAAVTFTGSAVAVPDWAALAGAAMSAPALSTPATVAAAVAAHSLLLKTMPYVSFVTDRAIGGYARHAARAPFGESLGEH